MNVFILCTGRCGSASFIKASQHITNFTAQHESQSSYYGRFSVCYPENNIEADNRLSWKLGRLDIEYGSSAFYVHLKRRDIATAKSFVKRWDFGIMKSYWSDILLGLDSSNFSDEDKFQVALDYCDTVNSNIELFLRDKPNSMTISLENIRKDFKVFWRLIEAEGNIEFALSEFEHMYNRSN
tara:strand:- start:355 stop:900 length:546 start_codon:yes stop_codon:yes gene_type:complete